MRGEKEVRARCGSPRVLYRARSCEIGTKEFSHGEFSSKSKHSRAEKERATRKGKGLPTEVIRIFLYLSLPMFSSQVPPVLRSEPSRAQNRVRIETPSFPHRKVMSRKRLLWF